MATMDTMDRTGRVHIQPGMDVFDVDAHKIGTVVHLHERAGSGATGTAGATGATGAMAGTGVMGAPSMTGATGVGEYIVEVKTGFLGLGKHYFIPQSAVRDVTEGGVFLSTSRETVKESGWETRPSELGVQPASQERVRPAEDTVARAAEAATWEEALPRYRTRCLERYGDDANWQRYEPRYRFAWEMSRAPDLAGKPWSGAEEELRRRWEVLQPNDPWEGASETIRDVWERVPAG